MDHVAPSPAGAEARILGLVGCDQVRIVVGGKKLHRVAGDIDSAEQAVDLAQLPFGEAERVSAAEVSDKMRSLVNVSPKVSSTLRAVTRSMIVIAATSPPRAVAGPAAIYGGVMVVEVAGGAVVVVVGPGSVVVVTGGLVPSSMSLGRMG